MKKFFLLMTVIFMAAVASAQTVTESKSLDNFYIGINGGVATATRGHAWLKDLQPNAGLRIGRNFTPVFGLAVESNAYFKNTNGFTTGTVVNALNTSLLGTVNLTNWFGGYKGEPRVFEVSALYGLGWGHVFGHPYEEYKTDVLTSKAGLDLAFNLGKAKAWQIYVEPAMVWGLNGDGYDGVKYDIHQSSFQVNVGLVYKFKNSNGTHNFKIAQLRDQSEIDALNAQINGLRHDLNGRDAELANKNREIDELKKELEDCQNRPVKTVKEYVKPVTATNLQPTVLFRQGKSVIDPAQYAPIELIATYMKNHPEAKVEIKGYASPEGSKEINQKLSEERAEAVKNALVKKYRISADRLTTKGMGATDKLFEQVEFNRVATFNDNAKGE
ncbi:MAG: OmpA family protein [Prevotella sp.]